MRCLSPLTLHLCRTGYNILRLQVGRRHKARGRISIDSEPWSVSPTQKVTKQCRIRVAWSFSSGAFLAARGRLRRGSAKKVEPPHSLTSKGSNRQFLIVFQDAVKLLHQIGEFLGVFFPNNGLSEILPILPRISGHSSCFFQGIRGSSGVGNTSSPLSPSIPAQMIGRCGCGNQPRFKRSVSLDPTVLV